MTKNYFKLKAKLKKFWLMYMFIMIMILSTMIMISSMSWLNAWMGMEINLMSFIPLMLNKSSMKISNSMMIYFIIQASSSSILLIMIIFMKMKFDINKMSIVLMFIQMSLMMKLGVAPLHWWLPKVLMNLNWMNCFIILTWQKVGPLFMLMNSNNNMLIYLMALISNYMGAIQGMNQSSIKMILNYSSVNHLGWMLMTMILNMKLLMFYLLIYFFINLSVCMIMNNLDSTYINQLFKNNNQNMNIKIILISMFLSMAGLPPMLGFLPKILSLMVMIKNKMIMESIMFIIASTISLSFYINPLMSMLIFAKNNNKWTNKNNNLMKSLMTKIFLINMLMNSMIIGPLMNNLM
uniref:NADH dehydrogenase subunit 2 n=1 Tax=Profenusa thomsoni TaxID=430669 RepID=UPI002E77186F|nr:NADH dehydrogenase subunit 2 [Profenusa thomsoni]WPN89804.1 NADH dehydrogenase subunit 2 [Profenusa thomsoni]